jgi:hypothetical protein
MSDGQGLVGRVFGRAARRDPGEAVASVLPARVRAALGQVAPETTPEVVPEDIGLAPESLAFTLLVDAPILPDAGDIVQAVNAFSVDAGAESIAQSADGDASLLLRVGGRMISVVLDPQPMADDVLLIAAEANPDWPQGAAAAAAHTAQIVVASAGPRAGNTADRYATALQLQLVAATVAALAEARAAHWNGTAALLDPVALIDSAAAIGRSGRADPTTLVQFHLVEDDIEGRESFGLSSAGLAPFVGHELLFAPAEIEPEALGARAIGLVEYLLTHGPILRHGDSFGADETECFRVHRVGGDAGQAPRLVVTVEHYAPLAAVA